MPHNSSPCSVSSQFSDLQPPVVAQPPFPICAEEIDVAGNIDLSSARLTTCSRTAAQQGADISEVGFATPLDQPLHLQGHDLL